MLKLSFLNNYTVQFFYAVSANHFTWKKFSKTSSMFPLRPNPDKPKKSNRLRIATDHGSQTHLSKSTNLIFSNKGPIDDSSLLEEYYAIEEKSIVFLCRCLFPRHNEIVMYSFPIKTPS